MQRFQNNPFYFIWRNCFPSELDIGSPNCKFFSGSVILDSLFNRSLVHIVTNYCCCTLSNWRGSLYQAFRITVKIHLINYMLGKMTP